MRGGEDSVYPSEAILSIMKFNCNANEGYRKEYLCDTEGGDWDRKRNRKRRGISPNPPLLKQF